MLSFDRAMRATRGARDYQEDTALLWPGDAASAPQGGAPAGSGTLLAVLADGMGGHAGGALASRTVCDEFRQAYAGLEGDVTSALIEGLRAANAAIAGKVESDPLLAGMGSTLVGVLFEDAGMSWVSVGDSPLLLWRRGEIEPLNEDHSLAPDIDRRMRAGEITPEQAKRDPRRHMLRSAVTGEEIDLIDISCEPLRLEPDDYVILASDGLQTLEDSEVSRIIMAYGADGADAVASALIRTIDGLRELHQDNATVIVVRVNAESASGKV